MTKVIKVYAPATSANLSVGFDNLGLAVNPIDGAYLGDIVSVSESKTLEFIMEGEFASKLPNTEENIVYKAYVLFIEKLRFKEIKPKKLKVVLEKNMPIGSGLGSSACSVSAALVAYNKIHNNVFNKTELLMMMGEIEGLVSGGVHYDNVAPSFLGGLQLMVDNHTMVESIPVFKNWYWILAYPGIKVSTAEARSILPDTYSRADIIAQSRNLASFIHACHTNNEQLAIASLRDYVAEPFRERLLPNFQSIKTSLRNNGALSVGISGSGPTVYAIANSLSIAQSLKEIFQKQYLQNEEGFVHICKVNYQGTVEID